MHNEVLEFSLKEAFPKAREYFLRSSGINMESSKHLRMWERAMKVYEDLATSTNLKVIFSVGKPDDLKEEDMILYSHRFTCKAFRQLSLNNIRSSYIYVLTTGYLNTDYQLVMDQLYADIWGTSLVDASRDLFREYIGRCEQSETEDIVLTQSFGPGYYGMDVKEVSKFFDTLDTAKIGVSLHPGGMMLPEKSCAGIYLSIKDKNQLPPAECEDCIGTPSGCSFCNIRGA